MGELITRRIVKPGDCLIGFGIPTSREGFLQAQAAPANRDFVVNCFPDYRDYHRQVISYVEELVPVITHLGASVVLDLTLDDFAALFRKQASVIILFAHGTDGSIEFADGLAGAEEVIAAVPPAFDGIIDLCVCHSIELALTLRRARQYCIIKYTETVATPAFWLYFYIAVLKRLQEHETNYLDAVDDTMEALQTQFERESCPDWKNYFRNFLSKLVS
jgi:hypothetical protein